MMSKAKLKSYSLDEKIKILKCLDQPGMDRKSVREKYGLSESTLRGFIKKYDDLSDKEDVEPPLREILESLTKVRTFSQKNGLSTHIPSSLKTIENMVTQEKNSRRTQANIKDYFKWNIEMVLY